MTTIEQILDLVDDRVGVGIDECFTEAELGGRERVAGDGFDCLLFSSYPVRLPEGRARRQRPLPLHDTTRRRADAVVRCNAIDGDLRALDGRLGTWRHADTHVEGRNASVDGDVDGRRKES